jgi:3'(2'), 5'-bisphosphate nucleotidase
LKDAGSTMRHAWLMTAIEAAVAAGAAILEVYDSEFSVAHKDDNSPLTLADTQAHQTIVTRLKATGLPILSEEGKDIPFTERCHWDYFWMVDPLDGTKEFIQRNGEFTVNIALIRHDHPVMGVIWVPVTRTLYFADAALGAYKVSPLTSPLADLEALRAQAQQLPGRRERTTFTVVASRSHMTPETEEFIRALEQEQGTIATTSMGSSLKLCLVAEGAADVYPRFAPTMEWDTAAGQAIVQAAGKQVIDHTTGQPMRYNKPNLLNHWFIVR